MMMSEEKLLRKFKEILEMSLEVHQAKVAKYLGISEDELFAKLVAWRHLQFKVNGDLIVVEDLAAFIDALDQQFKTWTGGGAGDKGEVVHAEPDAVASPTPIEKSTVEQPPAVEWEFPQPASALESLPTEQQLESAPIKDAHPSYIAPTSTREPLQLQPSTVGKITKRFTTSAQRELPGVIRSVATGKIGGEFYLSAACIDTHLYVLDKMLNLVGEVKFANWVRCCAMGDIDDDGDAEIVAGAGDRTVRVLKVNGKGIKELKRLEFPDIVNACAIADVNGDGRPEIIVGTWGDVVYIFETLNFKVVWQKKLKGWINFIVPGHVTDAGRVDLLVGTRDGFFYVIEGGDGHIIWDYKFPKEINAAAIGDVNNTGVPSLLVGGNTDVLTIFDGHGNILRELLVGTRILSMTVGDIDADKANEIILGCSDNTLRVLENQTKSIEGFALKWQGNFGNTIRGIQLYDRDGDGVNYMYLGGYDKALHVIKDFDLVPVQEISIPKPIGDARIEGKLAYDIAQLASFRETTFHVTHKVTNSGGDVLNEVLFQEVLPKFFTPPKKDEIIVKLTRKDNEDQIEMSMDAITIDPDNQTPSSVHTVNVTLTNLIKNEAIHGFQPGDVMTVTYPITSMKPNAQVVFKSDVLYQANTLPAGKTFEVRPAVTKISVAHIRLKFRKGKEIKKLSEGNYEITLFVENTGEFNLEGMTVIDKVPDSFQCTDFKPTEPGIVDLEGQYVLWWKLEVLEPGKGWSVTYKISGQGEYAASDAQFSV